MSPAARPVAGGMVLTVRLQPRSAREAVEGIGRLADGSEVIVARVRAAPVDEAANAALLSLIASALNVRKSAVAIIAGQHGRVKQLRIAGDPAALSSEIETWPRVS